jgi:hypothetical protein
MRLSMLRHSQRLAIICHTVTIEPADHSIVNVVLSTHHTLRLTAKTITLDDGTKGSYNDLDRALAGIEGQSPQQAAQKRQKQ